MTNFVQTYNIIMEPLTDKQQHFYDTLIAFFRKHMRLPTHREAARVNDMKSANNSVHYYQILVDKGYLIKDNKGNYRFSHPADAWPGSNGGEGTTIPVLGEITAGSMSEAVEADLGELTIRDFFPNSSNIYALRIKGLSMKGLGLSTGDKVILSKEELKNGEVGAVLYNGKTTLKRAFKEEGKIRLEPANPEYDDIIIKPGEFEEVTVLGKYLGYMNDDGLVKSPYD